MIKIENNSLYTFKNSPFADDGKYGTNPNISGFEPLQTSKMGRIYE